MFRQRQSYAHTTHSLCNASNVHKFPQSLFSSLHYNNFGAGRHSHSSHPLDQALLLFTSLFPSLLASSTAGCLPLFAAAPSAIFVLRLQLLAASKTALCPYVGHGLQQPWKPPGGGLGFETGRCPGGAGGKLSPELRNQMLRSGLLRGERPHRLGTPNQRTVPKRSGSKMNYIIQDNRHICTPVYPIPRAQDNQPSKCDINIVQFNPTMYIPGPIPET